MKLFVSGFDRNSEESFELKLNSKQIIEFIEMAENGQDEKIEIELRRVGQDTYKSKVLNAFTYIDFVDEAIEMLQTGERFAMETSTISFGVSGKSYTDAENSLKADEF